MSGRSRRQAAVGSALFFLAAPGVVAGLVPWWLTGYQLTPTVPWLLRLRIGVGGLLVLAGLAVLIRAFVRFVAEGHGTPAPVAPPETLVVGGDYRYVRNPMYVAVVTCLIGQAVILGWLSLDVYTVLVWLAMAAFVRWYEEPALRARYGSRYEDYRRAVPAWIPRLSPWTPAPQEGGSGDRG